MSLTQPLAQQITNVPAGSLASTNLQAAINELDLEKAPLDSPSFTGTPTGITKTHIGLPAVDNTSDASKPVSTAQASAIALRYGKNNILGTVSQSAGVPTGAVIERGSNANGEYVRFADGTQICTGSVAPVSNDNDGTNFTWAASFINGTYTMNANANAIASASVYGSLVVETRTVSTTTGAVKVLTHTQTTTLNPVNMTIMYSAIGRWF